MSLSKDQSEKMRAILTQAYREKEKIEVGDLWTEGIMQRIRAFGAEPRQHFLEIFGAFVWRLVPVVCILILTLTVVLIAFDFSSGVDAFQVFANGKEELTLAQLFEF